LHYSSSETPQPTQSLSRVMVVCIIHYTVMIFSLVARVNDSRIGLGSLAYSKVSSSPPHLALIPVFSDMVDSLLPIPYRRVRFQCSKGRSRHTNTFNDAVVDHV